MRNRLLLVLVGSSALALSLAVVQSVPAQTTAEQSAPQAQQSPQLEQMQARMRTMHEQMSALRNTANPAERQKLLQAHMQTMQAQMQSMRMMGGAMMTGTMHQGDGMGGMQSGSMMGDRSDGKAGPRHQMMQDRMDMMQMMMEQMMDHMQMQSTIHSPAGER